MTEVKKFLDIRTKSWIKKNKIARTTVSYPSSKSVGIIFSIEDRKKHEAIKKFIKTLEEDGKEVEVLGYLGDKKENHEFLFNFFTPKDISFWGSYKSEEIHNFAKKSFDYLFHIDESPATVINGILALSQAKCRVGKFAEGHDKFYELMVDVKSKDADSIIHEIYRYTSILN